MTSTSNITPKPQEKSISQLTELSTQVLKLVASLSTNPLISVVTAAYVIGLLYLPRHILSLLLSPVSISALLLLAALLHFGSSAAHSVQEEKQKRPPSPPCVDTPGADCKTPASFLGSSQKPVFFTENHHLVDWAWWRHPLEVIYEEYEGEDEDEEGSGESPGSSRSRDRARGRQGMRGLESLGMCLSTDDSEDDTESDAGRGTSPTWDSLESLCFRWEVEDDGLIEISLEEDNLIEIDISAYP